MLNFEDEMKAVKRGYVVLSLEEYDSLRDEIATANMRAYEAEQLANIRIAEAAANNEAITSSLISVAKRTYGGHEIDIVFNKYSIRRLALDMLGKTFSAEELEGYEIKSADDMLILDEILAYRADTPEE